MLAGPRRTPFRERTESEAVRGRSGCAPAGPEWSGGLTGRGPAPARWHRGRRNRSQNVPQRRPSFTLCHKALGQIFSFPSRSLSFRAKSRNLLLLSEKIMRDVSTALDMTKAVIFSRLSQFAPTPADTPERLSAPSPSGRSSFADDLEFPSSPPPVRVCAKSADA